MTLSARRYLTLWPRRSDRRTWVAEMSLVTHSRTIWMFLRYFHSKSDWWMNLCGSLLLRVMQTKPWRPTISAISSCFHMLGIPKDSRTSAPHSNISWSSSEHRETSLSAQHKSQLIHTVHMLQVKNFRTPPILPVFYWNLSSLMSRWD